MLLSYWYLCWIDFWRLPETHHSRRCETKAYQYRFKYLRNVWFVVLACLAVLGQPVLLIFGVTLLTFVSLMFLDEI
jgi:hypothetical protein